MKKFLKSLAFAFVGIMALSSCEDVPAPYIMPEKPSVGNGIGYTSASLKSGWSSMAVNGLNDPWSQGSSYTQATGSQKWDGENRSYKEVEGYLFSPSLNTTSENGKVFTTFDYCVGYTSGATGDPDYKDHIKMYVSKTYQDGDQFVKEQWEEMPFEATFTSTDWTLTTVSVAVPEAYINQENVHFAYWFYAPANKSCTFEIKNFKLADTEYVENGEDGGDTGSTKVGTKEAPVSVADAKLASGKTGYVTGYIVGFVDGQKLEENATFGAASASETEVLLADAADCTDATLCFPVQLPAGDIRTALNPNIASNIGKKVTVYGSIEQYFGTTGMKGTSFAILDGKEIGTDPDAIVEYNAKGTGTERDPFNVDGIIKYTSALAKDAKSSDDIWFKGTIASITEAPGNSYGNATFYITDDDTENQFYCYRVMAGPEKAKFTSADQLKVGDEVLICGKVTNFKGNTPETVSGEAYVVTVNGNSLTNEGEGGDKGDEGDKGDGDQNTGDGMTINNLPADITVNSYGSQAVADESTWLTWTWKDVEFAGARICKASAINGTIQFQGNDTDETKQGFIFNKTTWPTAIQKITLVLKVKENTNGNTYDPNYTLYAGSTAHPTGNEITPTSSMTTADGIRTYTQVFDLSNANAKFFTIHNNKAGVLYVEKIVVE